MQHRLDRLLRAIQEEGLTPDETLGGGVHADVITDRIVHNATWVEIGEVNMRQSRGADRWQ